MELMSVKDTAEQIALAINKVMGVDVVIVDNRYNRVADTFRYERDRIIVRKESIVGRIIESGMPLAIDDKTAFHNCIGCPDFNRCQMQSLIGVPIIYKGATMGAIALSIAPRYRKELFGNLSHTIGFLETMAEMLSGKLRTADDYEKLNLAKKQREILIDSMDDAIVLVNPEGRVVYYNGRFDKLFLGGRDAADVHMTALVTHPQIETFFRSKDDIHARLIYCETRTGSFDGFLSATSLDVDQKYYGAVLSFRPIRRMDAAAGDGAVSERHTLDDFIAHSPLLVKAKSKALSAAKNDEVVLIEGGDPAMRRELARAIHFSSKRSGGSYIAVECDKEDPAELERQLFGDDDAGVFSSIRLAHKGTLCLSEVGALPQYLQRRICDYLARRTVTAMHSEMPSDARLLVTSGRRVDELAAEEHFDEGFLERIVVNRIALPGLGGCPADIAAYFDSYVQIFTDRYGTGPLDIDPDIIDQLCACSWPGGLPQLRMATESLVRASRGGVMQMRPLPGLVFQDDTSQPKPIRDLVKNQIQTLMDAGKSREEIADILQISRATLYRKLKSYKGDTPS